MAPSRSPLISFSNATVVVGFGVLRIEFNGFREVGNGAVQIAAWWHLGNATVDKILSGLFAECRHTAAPEQTGEQAGSRRLGGTWLT
jgi:hypothetical protein